MPIKKKKLLNAPSWVETLDDINECARVVVFLKKNRQNAYSVDEIQNEFTVSTSRSAINSLQKTELVGMRGGMYYVEDESKCKELIKLADI